MQMISLISEQIVERDKWIKHFSDNYGFEFFPPTFNEVPFVSQFFDNENKKSASKIEQYLLTSCPVYVGDPDYQNSTRVLRREIFTKEEFEKYNLYNKLAINTGCAGKILSLIFLRRGLKIDYLHISNPKNNVYNKKPFKEKVKMIECFDAKLYKILEKLYVDYS